jgi:ubiquinone biosynthesis monooxygenase Coq6
MAAIDKLHKLFSSTLEPLVWARSVGLEVINELDTVKAAIVTAAGGSHHLEGERPITTGGWPLAARGVEAIASGVGVAKVAGEMVGNGLQGLLKRRDLKQ